MCPNLQFNENEATEICFSCYEIINSFYSFYVRVLDNQTYFSATIEQHLQFYKDNDFNNALPPPTTSSIEHFDDQQTNPKLMFTISSLGGPPTDGLIKYEDTLDLANYKVAVNNPQLSIECNSYVTSEKCDSNIPDNDIVIILPNNVIQIDNAVSTTTTEMSDKEPVKISLEEYAEGKEKQDAVEQNPIEQNSTEQNLIEQNPIEQNPIEQNSMAPISLENNIAAQIMEQSIEEMVEKTDNTTLFKTKSKKKRNAQQKIVPKDNNIDHQTDKLPDHLKVRMTKAKGDAQIKEFVSLVCDICQNNHQYRTFKDVQEHFQNKHQIRGYVTCCDKKFHRKDRLMNHITNHINPDAFK